MYFSGSSDKIKEKILSSGKLYNTYLDPGYEESIYLSQKEAERRKELVGEVHYDHRLALLKGKYLHNSWTEFGYKIDQIVYFRLKST